MNQQITIVQFRAENYKNLKCVVIKPNGNIVDITGKNGAGKSAIIEAIFTTLTGTRIDDAVRHGQEKAEVEIDMGDYIVKRKWTTKGEYLKVEGLPKGETPQGFLDKIIGKLSFDPLSFTKYKGKEQIEILKKLVGLDFSDLDLEAKKVFDERSIMNSKVRDVIAQLENSEAPDPETPDVELSYKDALQDIEALREKQEAFKRAVEVQKHLATCISSASIQIGAKNRQIEQLHAEIKAIEQGILEDTNKINQIILPVEITDQQIQAANANVQDMEQKNVRIRSAVRYRKLIKESEKLKNESEAFTQRLERITQDKSTRIANAEFPVPGLGLGEEWVVYKGTPFHRLSTGEQILISTAIGMKLNPTLKVIFIHEGSEIDEDNLTKLETMAKTEGYTIWMTSVAQTQQVDGKTVYPGGIYLEDGTIEAMDGKKVIKEDEVNQTQQTEEKANA